MYGNPFFSPWNGYGVWTYLYPAPWGWGEPEPLPWSAQWGWGNPDPVPWVNRGVWDNPYPSPWILLRGGKGPAWDDNTFPHTEHKRPTADGSSLPWINE